MTAKCLETRKPVYANWKMQNENYLIILLKFALLFHKMIINSYLMLGNDMKSLLI